MQFHIPYHICAQKYPTKRLALYYAIRDCIASGVLVIDTRLPSSREMAAPPAPSVTAHTFIPTPIGGGNVAWRQSDAGHWAGDGDTAVSIGLNGIVHTPKTCHGWHVPSVAQIGSERLPDRGQGGGIPTVVHSSIACQRRSQESVCRISSHCPLSGGASTIAYGNGCG